MFLQKKCVYFNNDFVRNYVSFETIIFYKTIASYKIIILQNNPIENMILYKTLTSFKIIILQKNKHII